VLCLQHSRFVEIYPIRSWETNLCFLRGVLPQAPMVLDTPGVGIILEEDTLHNEES
jgi:hypothetical protein